MDKSTKMSTLVDSQPEADTRDDFLLAQMLQLEFDKEHDTKLTAEEKHFNKHSKGVCVFSNLAIHVLTMYLSCLPILIEENSIFPTKLF